MQTTLDVAPSVPKVDITQGNTTKLTEEHIEYLYRTFCPSFLLETQIQDRILEEKAEEEEIKNEFEYLQQYEEFRPRTEYIRVGRNARKKTNF